AAGPPIRRHIALHLYSKRPTVDAGEKMNGFDTRAASFATFVAAAVVSGCTPAGDPAEVHRATLARFCFDCHNDVERVAELSLERLNLAAVAADGEHWEKVVRKLRAGVMPPADAPRPAPEARIALAEWLEHELD